MACSSTSQSYAQSHLDCPVCLSTFKNPRQFPCGHIFCGPPEICYRALEDERGCKCPMCPKTVSLRELNNLPPMYQFNHFLEESVKAGMKRAPRAKPCKKHGLGIKFKCVPCNVPMCESCLVLNHNGHKCEKIDRPQTEDKKIAQAKEVFQKFESLKKKNKAIVEKCNASQNQIDQVFKKSRSLGAQLRAHLKKYRDIDASFTKHESDSKTALQNVFDSGEMPQGPLFEALNFVKAQDRRFAQKSPEVEMKEYVESLIKISTDITDILVSFAEKFDQQGACGSKTKKPEVEIDDSDDSDSIQCLGQVGESDSGEDMDLTS